MTDARIILWFTWFVVGGWLRDISMLVRNDDAGFFKPHFAQGIEKSCIGLRRRAE